MVFIKGEYNSNHNFEVELESLHLLVRRHLVRVPGRAVLRRLLLLGPHAQTSTQPAFRHTPTSIPPALTPPSTTISCPARASTPRTRTGMPATSRSRPSSAAARALLARTRRGVRPMIYLPLRGALPFRVNSPCFRTREQAMKMTKLVAEGVSYPAARSLESWLGLLWRG